MPHIVELYIKRASSQEHRYYKHHHACRCQGTSTQRRARRCWRCQGPGTATWTCSAAMRRETLSQAPRPLASGRCIPHRKSLQCWMQLCVPLLGLAPMLLSTVCDDDQSVQLSHSRALPPSSLPHHSSLGECGGYCKLASSLRCLSLCNRCVWCLSTTRLGRAG